MEIDPEVKKALDNKDGILPENNIFENKASEANQEQPRLVAIKKQKTISKSPSPFLNLIQWT